MSPLSAPPADIADRLVDYLVDTPEGSVGILDGFGRDGQGRAAFLIVAQGWFGRRQLRIPIEQLTEVDHAGKRILLAPGAAPIEHKGPFMRLIDLGESESQEDSSKRERDEAGWSATERRPLHSEIVEEEPRSAALNVAAELATAGDRSPCPACGRNTRTTPRGACTDCWQRKLPDGEAVFRPAHTRTSSRPEPVSGVPPWVVVVAIAATVAGLVAGLAVTL